MVLITIAPVQAHGCGALWLRPTAPYWAPRLIGLGGEAAQPNPDSAVGTPVKI
ncbi:MAG: hypothetical protein ACO4AJ_04420 [Prochlorothrix sp.]